MSAYLRSLRQAVVRTTVTATTVVVLVEVTTHLPSQGRASETYHRFVDDAITPLLRHYTSPETAHQIALFSARYGLAPIFRPSAKEQETSLSTNVFGLTFSNPIGLAAGFDKNGTSILGMQNMGFGFVEIGSVTPLPQAGNPKPRVFRLIPDNAIINRYGFNSAGIEIVEQNLKAYRESFLEQAEPTNDIEGDNTQPLHRIVHTLMSIQKSITTLHKMMFPSHFYTPSTLVGVNIGKNKISKTSEIDDYCQGILTLGPYADYLVINVSSPNTPGLRDLQEPLALQELIVECLKQRDQLPRKVPLLIKLAPDLTDEEIRQISQVLLQCKLDGVIVCNTTLSRPPNLMGTDKDEVGGLSGEPLRDRSTECIKLIYEHTQGKIPIIGVGGISSAKDVLEKLKAGASLVQVYSVLAFEGPGIVTTIRRDLAALLKQAGFRSVQDVVGYSHEELYWTRKQAEKELKQDEPVLILNAEEIDEKFDDRNFPHNRDGDDTITVLTEDLNEVVFSEIESGVENQVPVMVLGETMEAA